MKTQILTDEQFDAPENQNRDNAIVGYRSIEPKTKPLNIAPVMQRSEQVCVCHGTGYYTDIDGKQQICNRH